MRRLIAGLALAVLVASLFIGDPVKAASPTIDIQNMPPLHYGDDLSIVVHGDVPGHPGEPRPKAQLRLDCDFGEGVYAELFYSPPSETLIVMHLAGNGAANWDAAGGGSADCVLALNVTKYQHYDYTVTAVLDSVAFHVEP